MLNSSKSHPLLWIVVFSFLYLKIDAQHQQPSIINVVKINPVGFFLSTLDGQFEKVITKRLTIQLGGSISTKDIELWDQLQGRIRGFSAYPELRYYIPPRIIESPNKNAPTGIYTGIWLKYQTLNVNINSKTNSAKNIEILDLESYSGGVMIGWQFWIKYRKSPLLLLDIFTGIGYQNSNIYGRIAEDGQFLFYKKKGLVPKLGLSIGYGF